MIIYMIENATARNSILTYTLGLKELEDPLKKDVLAFQNIFLYVTFMNFDFDKGVYEANFVAALKLSAIDEADLHDSIMSILRCVEWPQAKLQDRDLLTYLTTKFCQSYKKPIWQSFCAFFDCPSGQLERLYDSLIDVFKLGYDWLEVLKTIDCQENAPDERGRYRWAISSKRSPKN